MPVTLTVNGKKQAVDVDPRRTLLDLLRNDLDLTGAKKVCDRGSCGACTVLLDGKPVYSCMTLALDAEGRKVETVESLAKGDRYHPLQVAFVERDALMCGFCTPGFLMSSKALLDAKGSPSLEDVKNLCRCGTYPRIFEAVLEASKKA
jgi:aerobic-type carbon monoxide dehydrogenase small subunit (CoxS/CutS family)